MNLAVMMAAYNSRTYIEAALRSLLTQDGVGALDVIVVDDGSTDDTAGVVAGVAADWPQVRMIRTANQGVAAARNVGLQALRPCADLVSFLDSDDLLPAGRFARDIAHFRADPGLDLTYGTTTLFRKANIGGTAPSPDGQTASGRGVVLGAGTYRAAYLKAVGPFDEGFRQAEDMDFMLRLLERGPRYLVQDETSLYYRRHSGNMTHDRDQLRRDFSRALMLSIKRRRLGGLAPYHADLFDAKSLIEAHGW